MEKVPLQYLLSLVNPLEVDVWGCGPISLDLIKRSSSLDKPWNPDSEEYWTAEQHAGRIKFLSQQKKLDPILLDVGVFGDETPKILDGHHRLVAAIFRKDKEVSCEIQGWVEYRPWISN